CSILTYTVGSTVYGSDSW
nr:immunoglobulin heavy chain junction region [Macaca mulatta]MOV52085.1 immunoglobulin heavy chain junction region [Macaca mulatta]MOV52776.1 immunoglobulin heavy chain junction region [Macaca mulatta]